MGNEEDFKAEEFTQFSQTDGKKEVEVMGEKRDIHYKAKCFINKAQTIGYAEVEMEGSTQVAFISRTSSGTVMTLTGEQIGRLPLKVEGLHTITSVLKDTPVGTICTEHKKAFDGEAPIQDGAWVKAQTINLPNTAVDVALAFVKQFMESIETVADQMGKAVGEIGKGLGEAMGQAMDGISEGLHDVTTADAVKLAKKPKPRKAGPKPKPKKKARPAKKGKAGKKKR